MEMEKILTESRFVYDVEDNLWYDEHPDRRKHIMRVGLSGPYMDDSFKAVLFNGGYDHKIGEYRRPQDLDEAIKKTALKNKIQ